MKKSLLFTLTLVLTFNSQAYTANKAKRTSWKLDAVHYVECQHYSGVLYKFKKGYKVMYRTIGKERFFPVWDLCKVNRVNWEASKDSKRGYKF